MNYLIRNRFEGFDRKGKAIYTPVDLGIVALGILLGVAGAVRLMERY
jgi:hypothetical protein